MMRFRQLYLFPALLTVAALSLTSCDEVAPEDRYIKLEGISPKRSVLLEDFTGQFCSNCPDAHVIIDQIHELYGDYVIPVSIHAGSFGASMEDWTDFSYEDVVGLMTPQGEALNKQYGIKAWPAGVINDSGEVLTMDMWASAVRSALEIQTELTLECTATVDDGIITVTADYHTLMDIPGCTLHLWVTEDSIVSFQQVNDLFVEDYVHNHVFRTSITPLSGMPIECKAYIDYEPVTATVPVAWNEYERWNVEQLHIVAFVRSSTGVIQATRCRVVSANSAHQPSESD